MAIHLRQICLVAGELAPVMDDLRAVLGVEGGHIDPGVGKYGLENTLLTIGTQFLEVVAPVQDGTAAGRYIDRRGGDGGYMVICQCESLEEQTALRARAKAAGVREAHVSDRGDWNIMQLHPGDLKAAFLEADWDTECDVTGRWMPAGGTGWQDEPKGAALAMTAAELQSDDPAGLAALWGRVLGVAVSEGDVPEVRLANFTLRFVPPGDDRGPGLSALDVVVEDPARGIAMAARRGLPVSGSDVVVCGTTLRLIPA
ncbi:hypothetical protein ATO6_23545 [Oceanicola sp. 22II-s10i]|uniref:VOC family protein n=1 Tax=Oceanicola sp. 22II-s10i TaxID=1317116 RepID=UPI000B526689|nr:VOC family protein [Oceanicola sp. 22II-s10i]OWU81716.1 hypothetical protein ATO6_23545 [Oceanicola sp. 22II-s10i]